jgi:YfiH family protein
MFMSVTLPEPDQSFEWIPAPWIPTPPATDETSAVLQCRPLAAIASHFFTTRALQLRGDTDEARADWANVAAGIGVPSASLQRMRQVHGCGTFAVADASTSLAAPPEADALITDRRDVALVVQVADCVPLLIADPRTGAVAAVHGGWRGTAASIAIAAVRRLHQEYGSDPADLVAAIGPSIGACCYQVGPEVREAFLQAGHSTTSLDAWFTPERGETAGVPTDRLRLDTWAANRDQLVAAGLRPERVHVAALCTATHRSRFFSYRVEGPGTGRLLGVIRRPA